MHLRARFFEDSRNAFDGCIIAYARDDPMLRGVFPSGIARAIRTFLYHKKMVYNPFLFPTTMVSIRLSYDLVFSRS